MKDSIKAVDITIQKKFKQLVDAKRGGINFNFKNELKRELETMLLELNENDPMERIEIENLLQEIEGRRTKITCIQ